MWPSLTQSFFSSFLALSLLACQAPQSLTQTPAPVAPTQSLDKAAYSEAFVKIFDDFNTETREASQAAPPNLQNFAVPGASSSAPDPSNGSSEPTADLQLPEASAGESTDSENEVNTSPALPPEHSELMKKLLMAQLQSLDKMQSELKALQAPPELTEKHSLLLEYFELSHQMTRALLDAIEESGPEVINQNPQTILQGQQKDNFERLLAIQSEAQSFMAELQIEVFHQMRLVQQSEAVLSSSDYLMQLQAQFPQLSEMSPMLLVMSGLTAPPADAANSENLDFMQRLLAQNQQKLESIARMHPPEDNAKGHTSLFALLHLQGQMLNMMADVLEASGQTEASSPQLLMAELLSQPAFFTLMSKISVLTPVFEAWVRSLPFEEQASEAPEAGVPKSAQTEVSEAELLNN